MGGISYVSISDRTFQDFWVPMFLFGMYAAPVYFLAGIPLSFLIEKVVNMIPFKSKMSLQLATSGLYGLAGIMAAFIYILILAFAEDELYLFPRDLLSYLVLGFVASVIYYFVIFIFDWRKRGIDKCKKM